MSFHGPRLRTSSALNSELNASAIALSYESPLLPTEATPSSRDPDQHLSRRGARCALIGGLDGPTSNEQFVTPAHRTDVSLWTELERPELQEDATVRMAQDTIFTPRRWPAPRW